MFYLVIVEFSEILHIYLCLLSINYSSETVELKVRIVESFNSLNDIA